MTLEKPMKIRKSRWSNCFQVSFTFNQIYLFRFLADDYILEPQVISTLTDYYTTGGEPDEANKLLADNYQGLSQIANFLGCCLSELELSEVPSTSKKHSIIDVKTVE
jgi:hypothetical protein